MRLLALLVICGCGGASAETPLTVSLGTPRDRVVAHLRARAFCPPAPDGPRPRIEVYPRCERPGAEWGEAWVSATYEAERLVELKRYERFADDARALERWNQLVGERTKLGPASAEATAALRARPLEPGTRSLQAFRVAADTVVGVYLLTPTPPHDASILEAIVRVPAR